MNNDHKHIVQVEDYAPLVGEEIVERVKDKARKLRGLRVCHVNSTFYGGGVAEMLDPLTLLMNGMGIKTEWRVIQGSPDFFSITKKMHNALQGGDINLSELKMHIYEDIVLQNAMRTFLDHDRIIIHDPQPLPMILHYVKRGPWIWRCHLDLSNPNQELWDYLVPYIERYDAVILSFEEYAQPLRTPQVFMMPAIDPFAIKNLDLGADEVQRRLDYYQIPTDLR